MNKVCLLGRLGKDPELKQTQSGMAVCNFSLATSSRVKGGEKTQWHNIVAWDKTAETCANFLGKGRQVAIEGRIEYRDWEDKDGNKRTSTDIVAERIHFVDSKKGDDRPAKQPDVEPTIDDIPF